MNVGNHSSRRELNSSRKGITGKEYIHSRETREETTAVGIHQHQARQQHKRQLKQQGTPTTARVPKTKETSVVEVMLQQ